MTNEPTLSDDLVERVAPLNLADYDHARGCEGREYTCDCGYDEQVEAALRERAGLASEVQRLREEIARLRQFERHVTDDGMQGASRYWEGRWRDEHAEIARKDEALRDTDARIECLQDVLDEVAIERFLRADSAERAKCKVCSAENFSAEWIEHRAGCPLARAALTGGQPAQPAEEKNDVDG